MTSDISINPFRCQRQTWQGSRVLFHSILALCCQYMRHLTGNWATEADEHRRKAIQLLDDALQNKPAHGKLHLLEPILILFTLDVSQRYSFCYYLTLTRKLVHALRCWKMDRSPEPGIFISTNVWGTCVAIYPSTTIASRHVTLVSDFTSFIYIFSNFHSSSGGMLHWH